LQGKRLRCNRGSRCDLRNAVQIYPPNVFTGTTDQFNQLKAISSLNDIPRFSSSCWSCVG